MVFFTTISSTLPIDLGRWSLVRSLGHALDAASLRSMGILKLDLLLGPRSRWVEVLVWVALVFTINCLHTSSSFGATHKILLVERVIHILDKRTLGSVGTWRISITWISSLATYTLPLAWSITSTTCPILAALSMVEFHAWNWFI